MARFSEQRLRSAHARCVLKTNLKAWIKKLKNILYIQYLETAPVSVQRLRMCAKDLSYLW
jgi:hypothetical protein